MNARRGLGGLAHGCAGHATVLLDDGATFVHIADQDTTGPSPLTRLTAFQEFAYAIADRCDEPPAARQARLSAPGGGERKPFALIVLRVTGEAVAEMTLFGKPRLFRPWGLPAAL